MNTIINQQLIQNLCNIREKWSKSNEIKEKYMNNKNG